MFPLLSTAIPSQPVILPALSGCGFAAFAYRLRAVRGLRVPFTLRPDRFKVGSSMETTNQYRRKRMTVRGLGATLLLSSFALGATVSVSSPSKGATVTSPVQFTATSSSPTCAKGVSAMGIYTAPGKLAYKVSGASLNTTLSLSPGTYYTVVQMWDNCGAAAAAPIKIIVASATSYPLSVQVVGTGSVTSSPAGINCPSACSATFATGTPVTLTAAAGTGYSFQGWTGSGCGSGSSCTVTVNAAISVTATFISSVPTYPVAVSLSGPGVVTSSPAGINCGTSCTANFPQNTQVTLTETPTAGAVFSGWGGACTGTGTCTITVTAATSVTAVFVATYPLTVQLTSGTGTVTSNPAGINCPTTCTANFVQSTQVTLAAVPGPGFTFSGWSGDCSGSLACTVTMAGASSVSAAFAGGGLKSINHFIIIAQENRSFDSYFGAMREYWANNGIADQSFDGLPQFNPSSGSAPLQGPAPALPGCDPAFPYDPKANPPETNPCTIDSSSPLVSSFHLQSMCLENPSPSWNESHVDWGLNDNTGVNPAQLNGFVKTAANDARRIVPPMMDTTGLRAMGYYDGNDLNYYYYMASQFATSDRWFSPAMSRTQINRMYLLSGTSQGHAYPLNANQTQLTAKTIFEALQNAGVSWRIYIRPNPTARNYPTVSCVAFDTNPKCLYQISYLNMFTYGNRVANDPILSLNLVPVSQFATDAKNGTLAQFSFIEPASASGLDEHPSDYDPTPSQPIPCCSVQEGANYVSGLINSLMTSSSWKDSALLLTYDEAGGFYDHVSPQPMPAPGDIAQPTDLLPGDICTVTTGPTCGFNNTGYRVPLIVVSPFSKKNYVSHKNADLTALLKLVETRFGIPSLTNRDAGQIDMSNEFFDFVNVPWMIPPTPPKQIRGSQCTLNPPTP
jgi:phospholipase C